MKEEEVKTKKVSCYTPFTKVEVVGDCMAHFNKQTNILWVTSLQRRRKHDSV